MDPHVGVDCERLWRGGGEGGWGPTVQILGGVGSVAGELAAFFCEETL